jgi:hypothetical protein
MELYLVNGTISNQTKHWNYHGGCGSESIGVMIYVSAVVFMHEASKWQWRKSSWCQSIVTQFIFLGLRRNCFVSVHDAM